MGKVISGRYEELEQLGHGGQGVVYKVRLLNHKTVLALKALPSYFLANPTTIGRLEQEAQVLMRLRHRNIVQVVGSGRDEALGLIYIVMEYIEGKTLKEYIQEKGALPLSEVLEITRQVGTALAYAHALTPPVIHRDIKPSNIIIEDFSGRVVLLDFGIAKELSETSDSHTRTGYMVGTWKYSSPEQLRHEPLTGSADIYSLGMVMYEMYTGVPFFPGRDEPSILGKILHDPQEYELSFPQAPIPAFVELLQKAIAKSREKRYAGMTDFLHDVDTCWSMLDETRILGIDESLFVRPPPFPDPAGEEKTAILDANLDKAVIPNQQDDRDIETIDAEIRKLQEERHKRFVATLQARVKEAREKAVLAGGQQWAEAKIGQGVVQEEQAQALLRESRYPEAQKVFELALASFTQAHEETLRAKLRSRAEQARREVEVAKGDADRLGALEHAPDAYTRAREFVAEAESRFKQEGYEEALKHYADARSSFEDARDLAYREKRREEANAARLEASTAREAALEEGAEALAASFVEEARRNEQRAAAALEREEFTQARMLYLAASQKYEQAQRRAHSEHLQREMASAAQLAEDVQAQTHAPEVYERAVGLLNHADECFTQTSYQEALQKYEDACASFVEAGEFVAAQEARREHALQAQEHMQHAQQEAQKARADVFAAEIFAQGQESETEANAAFARADFLSAQKFYETAAQSYRRTEDRARVERRQKWQQAMHFAQQALAVQDRLRAADPHIDLHPHYRQADELYQRAQAYLAAEKYEQAELLYQQVQMQYDALLQVVEEEHASQALFEARQRQEHAQEAAERVGAPQRFGTQWQQATHCVSTAQQHEQDGRRVEAEARYREAEQLFVKLTEEASQQAAREETERQQRVRERKQQVAATRLDAEEAGARTYAQAAYQQASQNEQAGDKACAAARWEEAEEQFARALEQFAVAMAGARQRKGAHDNARQAQQRALVMRDEVPMEQATALFPEQAAQGQALISAAENALQRADFSEAQQEFSQAEAVFAQLRLDVDAHVAQMHVSDEPTRVADRSAVMGPNVPLAAPVTIDALQPEPENLSQENKGGLTAEPEDETLILRSLPSPDEVQEKKVSSVQAPGVSGKDSDKPVFSHAQPHAEQHTPQITVKVSPSHPVPPARPIQKHVVIGAALVAVIAGLVVAYLGSREESPSPQDTIESPQTVPAPSLPGVSARPAPDTQEQIATSSEGPRTAAPVKAPVKEPSSPPSSLPTEAIVTLPPSPATRVASAKLVGLKPALDKRIAISEGEKQIFTVAVRPAGVKSLYYDWYVGERKQQTTSENRWTYSPGYDEGSEIAKLITVVLRDGDTELDRKSWTNVFVKHQPIVPKIVKLSPQPGKSISAAFGDELSFTIEVNDPDRIAGQPTWFLNKEKLGQGVTQTIRVPVSGAKHALIALLADGTGKKIATAEWNIVVPAAFQPNLVQTRPTGETLTTQAGRTVEFSAVAELPVRAQGSPAPQLEWSVDGVVQQNEESRQFRFLQEREGSYVVTVVGISRDGVRSTPKKWTVKVQPVAAVGGGRELTKDDVRNWIERYRQALEQKDAMALEQLGLDKGEVRTRIEDVKRYEDLVIKTEIQDQDIQLDGQPAKRASIRFTRRDIRDGIQTAPGIVRYTLEKQNNGRVVVAR